MSDEVQTPVDETPTRILEAAEAVFAERGFRTATVREILDRAGVKNIAAVNYHFGDKERLYIEAVKFAHATCATSVPFPDWPPGTPPRLKLRDFVRVMVLRMFHSQRPAALQLMMRELTEPSQACAEVVQEYIRPMAGVLESIIGELLPEMPQERRMLFGFSVVGQVLFYKLNRPILIHLIGAEQFERLDVDTIAQHITAVSLGGIDAALEAKP